MVSSNFNSLIMANGGGGGLAIGNAGKQILVLASCLLIVLSQQQFAFHVPTTTTNQTESNTPIETTTLISIEQQQQQQQQYNNDNQLNRCNNETEFTCQINNRCIPIEWHCDFNEQCPDGQDEFGCAPEWCDFGRDLCNWRNKFYHNNHHDHHNNDNSDQHQLNAWRRYIIHEPNRGGPKRVNNNDNNSQNCNHGQTTTTSKQMSDHQTRHGVPIDSAASATNSVVTKLKGLSDKVKNHRFLFAPLMVNINNNNNNNNSSSELKPEVRASDTHKQQSGKSTRSTRLTAPIISQTNSMCQLRFNYALWTSPTINSRQLTVRLTLNLRARPSVSGSGSRSRSAGAAPAKSLINGNTAAEAATKALRANDGDDGAQILWSKSLEASGFGHEGGSSSSTSFGGLDWSTGVAELGHLRWVELDFETIVTLIPIGSGGGGGASGNKSSEMSAEAEVDIEIAAAAATTTTSTTASAVRGRSSVHLLLPEFHASLSALANLRFVGCAWPQGIEQYRPMEASEFGDLDPTRDFSDWTVPVASTASAGESGAVPGRTCKGGSEFRCLSNICLDERYLCNFVDDCMNGGGAGAGRMGKQQEPPHLNNKMEQQQEPEEDDDDDESQSFCGRIMGMESFENGTELRDWSLYKASSSSSSFIPFWTLAGNWRAQSGGSGIGIRTGRGFTTTVNDGYNNNNDDTVQPSAIPSHDHTTRGPEGHFLSFELPGADKLPMIDNSNRGRNVSNDAQEVATATANNIFWVYLDSSWMRKLGANKDCRLKFFYNLVLADEPQQATTSANWWRRRQDQQSSSSSTKPTTQAHYIYLLVEHFTLNNNNNTTEKVTLNTFDNNPYYHYYSGGGGTKEAATAAATNRKLDGLIHAQLVAQFNPELTPTSPPSSQFGELVSNEPLANYIEYPGVDFWREANYKLKDLTEGDVFFVRISIVVEPIIGNRHPPSPILNSSQQRHGFEASAFAPAGATLNIDDLSTHFGCGALEFDGQDDGLRITLQNIKGNLTSSLSLTNYNIPQMPNTAAAAAAPPVHYFNGLRFRKHYPSTSFASSSSSFYAVQDPQKLIVWVISVLSCIMGFILVIVFVVVPYVERITINYHDQLTMGMSEIDSTPRNSTAPTAALATPYELTNDSDWEQVSRLWRRSTIPDETGEGTINLMESSSLASHLLMLATNSTTYNSSCTTISQGHQSVESFVRLGGCDTSGNNSSSSNSGAEISP